MIVDRYGRPWEELDAIRAQALIDGAFTLLSVDGVPLCGRLVDGQEPTVYTAVKWVSAAAPGRQSSDPSSGC